MAKDKNSKNDQATSNSKVLDSKKLLKRQKVSSFFGKTTAIIFLLIMTVVVIIPFYWMLNTSFKTQAEQLQNPPTLYPHEWTFENYRVAFLGKRKVTLAKYKQWQDENPGLIAKTEKYLNDNLTAYNDAKSRIDAINQEAALGNYTNKFNPNYIEIYKKIKPYKDKIDEKNNLTKEKIVKIDEYNAIVEKINKAQEEGRTADVQRLEQEKNTKQNEINQIKDRINQINNDLKDQNYKDLVAEEKKFIANNDIYTSEYRKNLDIINNYDSAKIKLGSLKTNLKTANTNYNTVYKSADDSFGIYIMHTLIVGVTSTIIGTIISIVGAFALSRLTFKGRDTIFTIMLATMMIPGEMMVISNFITVTKLYWTDNSVPSGTPGAYLAMTVPFLVTVFHIYLLRQTFKTIPDELYYAAKVDGTSDFKYLWKIMVPLAKSSIITITILKLMGAWNAYIWPNLVAQKHQLITVWLRSAFNDTSTGRVQLEVQMAATVLVLLPLLLVFIFLRKYIMRGVSRGGTKG